ncbi:MAG TPA: YHS domain-containing protein [Ignavibacteriaceae bacterium]|nr:YHS domain-containing protein [Ignavibacteriaceae bacterium]
MVKTTDNKLVLVLALSIFLFTGLVNAQVTEKLPCASKCSKSSTCTAVEETDCSSDHHDMSVEKTSKKIKPWNSVCPVSGKAVDANAKTVEYQGKVYGFNTNSSMEKFKKDPAKYAVKLNEDGKSAKKKDK